MPGPNTSYVCQRTNAKIKRRHYFHFFNSLFLFMFHKNFSIFWHVKWLVGTHFIANINVHSDEMVIPAKCTCVLNYATWALWVSDVFPLSVQTHKSQSEIIHKNVQQWNHKCRKREHRGINRRTRSRLLRCNTITLTSNYNKTKQRLTNSKCKYIFCFTRTRTGSKHHHSCQSSLYSRLHVISNKRFDLAEHEAGG